MGVGGPKPSLRTLTQRGLLLLLSFSVFVVIVVCFVF